ncbi:MAG: TlpA disulfide reductase family protein [Odoribacter sp.]
MKKFKSFCIAILCVMGATVVSAQQMSDDLKKFDRFRAIKDTVTSFEPLREIIDCGFNHLTNDPGSKLSIFVIKILTSNTEHGISEMKDAHKYGVEWADYVREKLNVYLADASLSQKSKAAFKLMKANRDINSLPIPAKVKMEDLKTIRAELDEVYYLDASLSYMQYVEIAYEQCLRDKVSHAEVMAYLESMKNSPNAGVQEHAKKELNAAENQFELKYIALDGREVDVAKLKGKVVLVDFWATWCGPCMAEMPHVKKLYDQYHKQGFEIVGISLDSDKARLEAYLKKNDITWPQHFDGKGWGNEIARKMGVNSAPTMFLLDKKGGIYSKNARGAELDKALNELMK